MNKYLRGAVCSIRGTCKAQLLKEEIETSISVALIQRSHSLQIGLQDNNWGEVEAA